MTRHEAEKALLTSLEKVVRGIERLEEQVRRDALLLDEIRARLGCAPRVKGIPVEATSRSALERKLTRHLAAMRKKWPDLFKDISKPRGD